MTLQAKTKYHVEDEVCDSLNQTVVCFGGGEREHPPSGVWPFHPLCSLPKKDTGLNDNLLEGSPCWFIVSYTNFVSKHTIEGVFMLTDATITNYPNVRNHCLNATW